MKLKPQPAVLLTIIEVCRGDNCRIEEARGSMRNAKRDIKKGIENAKLHAKYLYISNEKSDSSRKLNSMAYDKQLSFIERQKLTSKILNWRIKYITPERFTSKRIKRNNNYFILTTNIQTNRIASFTRWDGETERKLDIDELSKEKQDEELEHSTYRK